MCLSKHCLVFVNFVFLVLALVLLFVGIIIQNSLSGNYDLFSGYASTPAALMIAFGALLSFTSLLALLGVCCRSYCLLSVYICSLVVLVIVELSVGIAGFVAKSHVLSIVTNSMRSAESKYTSDHLVFVTWDSVQRNLKCCGVEKYDEWFPYLGNSSLPDSCCIVYAVDCGLVATEIGKFYQTDCSSAISYWADKHAILIAVFFSSIIVFQLLLLPCWKQYVDVLDHDSASLF